MPRLENRSQLMKYLGAKQKNTVWSWCAVDDDERKVYFSLWDDTGKKSPEGAMRYLVQEPHWGIDRATGRKSPARNDHDEKLALVTEHGYQPFGYLVVAKDPSVEPRQIEETKTGFIFELRLIHEADGVIRGEVTKRINLR
jgi:hypothetical protein